MCGITYAQPQTNVNCLQIEKSAQWHDPLTEPHAHPSSSGDIVQQIDVPMYSFIVKILSPAQKRLPKSSGFSWSFSRIIVRLFLKAAKCASLCNI